LKQGRRIWNIGRVPEAECNGDAMSNPDADRLVERYVAVWTEPDPAARRKAIEQLWTEDGAHVLHPPVEIRDAAAALGLCAHDARGPRLRRDRGTGRAGV
jgi:hypothetical protein